MEYFDYLYILGNTNIDWEPPRGTFDQSRIKKAKNKKQRNKAQKRKK